MEQKYLIKVLENEERLNKIVEVLALSPVTHFNISYCCIEIEINAYTRSFDGATKTEALLNCFRKGAEKLETIELENANGKFWVTKLYIEL